MGYNTGPWKSVACSKEATVYAGCKEEELQSILII